MTEQQRSALTQTAVSAAQARAVVNRFLLSRVESVFAAGTPELDSLAHLWKVPILSARLHRRGGRPRTGQCPHR